MDWFFNEYVYGTDLPAYHFEGDATANGDALALHFKLAQSGVPAGFKASVPIYLELADGRVAKVGFLGMRGVETKEQTVQLRKPPVAVKKVWINYYYDVLSTEN
jgi:hypothetical protein